MSVIIPTSLHLSLKIFSREILIEIMQIYVVSQKLRIQLLQFNLG